MNTASAVLLELFEQFPELSQASVARRVGVTGAAVSQWVSGACSPSLEHRVRLAHSLRLPDDVARRWYEAGSASVVVDAVSNGSAT